MELPMLYIPARTSHPDHGAHVVLVLLQIRKPGIMVHWLARAVVFPHLDKCSPHPMRGTQGHRAGHGVGEKATPTRWPLLPPAILTPAQRLDLLHPLVQLRVRCRLTHSHVVETLSTQLEDKRFVAVEIIAQDHQRQPRMVLTHPSYQAFGRIQLTV